MAKKIRVSVEPLRSREYQLCVDDLVYAETMSYSKAETEAKLVAGVLLDLIENGTIENVTVELDLCVRKNLKSNSTQVVP